MKIALVAAPFCLALAAGTSLAAEPDAHAGHHPPAAAEPIKSAASDPSDKADKNSMCPPMGHMTAKSGGGGETVGMGPHGMMAGGDMPKDGRQHMHCMEGGPSGAEAKPHSHERGGSDQSK